MPYYNHKSPIYSLTQAGSFSHEYTHLHGRGKGEISSQCTVPCFLFRIIMCEM